MVQVHGYHSDHDSECGGDGGEEQDGADPEDAFWCPKGECGVPFSGVKRRSNLCNHLNGACKYVAEGLLPSEMNRLRAMDIVKCVACAKFMPGRAYRVKHRKACFAGDGSAAAIVRGKYDEHGAECPEEVLVCSEANASWLDELSWDQVCLNLHSNATVTVPDGCQKQWRKQLG